MKLARSGTGGGLLLGAALLFALLAAGWACLITNCPRGGKRSGGAAAAAMPGPGRGREVQCAACGPGGEGLCVGPGICCSPLYGCVLAARGTCSHAGAFPPHCAAPASASPAGGAGGVPLDLPCGADLTPDGSAPGRCAAQGVCCTHDSCRIDAVCLSRDDNETALDTELLLTSLRRLG